MLSNTQLDASQTPSTQPESSQKTSAETKTTKDDALHAENLIVRGDSIKATVNKQLCLAMFGPASLTDKDEMKDSYNKLVEIIYQMSWQNAMKRWWGQYSKIQNEGKALRALEEELKKATERGEEGFRLYELFQELIQAFSKAKPLYTMYGKKQNRAYIEKFENEWSSQLNAKKTGGKQKPLCLIMKRNSMSDLISIEFDEEDVRPGSDRSAEESGHFSRECSFVHRFRC